MEKERIVIRLDLFDQTAPRACPNGGSRFGARWQQWIQEADLEQLALSKSPRTKSSIVDGPFLETKEWALG
jgi:hypothetical protein